MRVSLIDREDLRELKCAVDGLAGAMNKFAAAAENLERELTDRMDSIEHQLEEFRKQQNPESAQTIAPGHIPWTQRRDARIKRHFDRAQLMNKIQGAANGN